MRLVSYEMLDSRERGFGRIEGNSVIPMGLEPRPTGESTREAAAGSTRGSARGLQFRSDLKGFLASGGLGSVQVDAAEAGGAAEPVVPREPVRRRREMRFRSRKWS